MQQALRVLHQPEPDIRDDTPELVLPGGGETELDDYAGAGPAAPPGVFDGAAPSITAVVCSPVYAWPCDEALGVIYGNARCPHGESSGDPRAYNEGNYGLFQINAVHQERVQGELWRLFDPTANVAVAYQLWIERGWQPWACKP